MFENIIATLKGQHIVLKKEMADLKTETEKSAPDIAAITADLADFKNSLLEHLALEDNVFYPRLMEKFKKQNRDTGSIAAFIEEMNIIVKKVKIFLDQYKNAEDIKINFKDFQPSLDDIISTLLIRIESEEDGVYLYW